MGKGYNNYMCKKPFHPGSKANIKRAWMAEQQTENDKRKQEELKIQYEKEQELYHNRALLSKESKDKLGLNFMYEAPPGAKKEHQKEDNEPEYKFEWQRKYNAPREDFARGNAEIRDQPFGIQVRNVRCIKCHKWGHINTDKECPLYNKAGGAGDASNEMDPIELMRRMKEEEGLALKQSILGHRIDPNIANQQLLSSDEGEEDIEMQFLQSLSTKQKEKLLKKLEKLEKKTGREKRKSKSKKKKKSRKKSVTSSSESDEDVKKKRKSRKKSKRSKNESTDSYSSDDKTIKEEKSRNNRFKLNLHKKSHSNGIRTKPELSKGPKSGRIERGRSRSPARNPRARSPSNSPDRRYSASSRKRGRHSSSRSPIRKRSAESLGNSTRPSHHLNRELREHKS